MLTITLAMVSIPIVTYVDQMSSRGTCPGDKLHWGPDPLWPCNRASQKGRDQGAAIFVFVFVFVFDFVFLFVFGLVFMFVFVFIFAFDSMFFFMFATVFILKVALSNIFQEGKLSKTNIF